MASHYKSKKDRDQVYQNWLGYGLISLFFIVLFLAGIYIFITIKNHKEFDETTMCPLEGLESLTLIVIDRSEALKPAQQEMLRQHLIDIKESIPRFGSLEIYTVGQTDKVVLKSEIKICNPGRAQDVSQWTGNPKRIEKKWRTQFSQKLDEIFSRLIAANNDQSSPIMETIQSVAATSLTGSKMKDIPVKLIIVSDFIQHTPQYSQYKTMEDFSKFKSHANFQKFHTDLNGAEVEMFYLLRDSGQKIQSPAHVKFWYDYFSEKNATVVRYLPL